jgi:hypothetical protein
MDDMCQKFINIYESLHMTKSQPSLAHVTNVAKNQTNPTHLTTNQPS